MDNKAMIESLTSLRFFAALAIVFHHSRGVVLSQEFMYGLPLAAGVSFFFVLSGFILAYVYSGKMQKVGLYKFYTARFSRIWPAHIFTLVLVMLIFPSSEWAFGVEPSWVIAVINGALLHSLIPIPAYYFSFNGVSWSISTEMFFYIAFPVLIASLGKTWHVKLLILAGGGIIGAVAFNASGANYLSMAKLKDFSGHGLFYISPIARIQEFFIGMLFFKAFSYIKSWRGFNTLTCTVLEVVSVMAVMLLTIKFIHLSFEMSGRADGAVGEFLSHVFLALLFGTLILSFAMNKGVLSRLLSLKVFVVLGEISFSMYMIHQIIFRLYNSNRGYFEWMPVWVSYSLLLAFVIACAYVMWRFIEMPMQALLRKGFASLAGNSQARREASAS
ncbi:acyltransferase family protein [Pseudomonas koreensis]|uniref:Acyltransferase n=1 Tax=Pseudomonas koreensis TaxID=198620 RepID=A0AA94EUC7_9PSED|nr:acyltransferase [Pseudomonas koreensis]RVD80049.1 Acyltransferase [Pseudomonas koreensis]